MNANDLLELGFTKAGTKLKSKMDLKRRLLIAYEHYRFVTPQVMDRFQAAIKQKTYTVTDPCPQCHNHKKKKRKCTYCQGTGAREATYDKLCMTPIADYPEAPPQPVLDALKEAQKKEVFDTYEVGKVESVVDRPDPIVFGRIKGCDDRFFIAQWDNDVKIEDILTKFEG